MWLFTRGYLQKTPFSPLPPSKAVAAAGSHRFPVAPSKGFPWVVSQRPPGNEMRPASCTWPQPGSPQDAIHENLVANYPRRVKVG